MGTRESSDNGETHDIRIRNEDEDTKNAFAGFCAANGYTYSEGIHALTAFYQKNRETFEKQKRRIER